MNTAKDLTNRISNDLIMIRANFEKLQRLKDENKISEQVFYTKVYVEIMKTAHLYSVTEEAKQQGIAFEEKLMNYITGLIETLSENADIEVMGEMSQEEVKTVIDFANKYEDIIAENDLNDLI